MLVTHADTCTLAAPGLSLTKDHSILRLGHPRGFVHNEWFSAKGKTLTIRVPPFLRPVILTTDPAFATYVQRNVADFEVSARMGPTFRGMGLPSAITNSVGDARRRVKRSFETAFSASAMRYHFPNILDKTVQERNKLLEGPRSPAGEQTIVINARAEITKVMVDVIGKCYLGSDFDAIRTGTPSEMEVRVRKYYAARQKVNWWDYYTVSVATEAEPKNRH